MTLPGTVLAKKVLEQTKLTNRLYRQFTYKRAKDRSYKLWGGFTEDQATKLISALTKAGAVNARPVYTYYGRPSGSSPRQLGGVRFELASGE